MSRRSVDHLCAYFFYVQRPVSYYSIRNLGGLAQVQNTLIIHDRDDHMTSFENSVQLYNLMNEAGQSVQLKLTNELGHSLKGREVLKWGTDFLQIAHKLQT